jgi:predicted NUDIX family NTP pyrophosphohydrolase
MATRISAGLVLYREMSAGGLEVLLGHMGGPFWMKRDRAWTIPKGELDPGEDPYAAALREFEEELGAAPPASPGPDLDLGQVKQSGGKLVLAWARHVPADDDSLDVEAITSNTVEIEWPPRSGRRIEIPELDRVAWLPLDDARGLIVAAQAELLERLSALIAS